MVPLLVSALSLLLAAVLGFAAHRANCCTLTAVVEVFTSGRARMFLSFAKVVLWVIAVTLAVAMIWPQAVVVPQGHGLRPAALAGGFLFGVGAAVNRGCAFSTLAHLGSGNLAYLVTLAAMAGGTLVYLMVAPALPAADLPLPWSPLAEGGPLPWRWIAPLLWLWAAYEVSRLVRSAPAGATFRQRLAARRYRLSTAAFLIGASNAVLFAFYGPWAYTGVIAEAVAAALARGPAPSAERISLFLALLAGIAVSARLAGGFRIEFPSLRNGVWRTAGGLLMGVGAAMTPGGNFVLLLHGIPMLSPYALPALAAVALGIAVTVWTARRIGTPIPHIDCTGDVCAER
jgi:uncharacterized membrane protein YedE/YeeE